MADGFKISSTTTMPDVRTVLKQFNYGTAVGLTKTAKEAQAAVQGALRGKFTIRNRWLDNSPIAIKITPATPGTQFAEVYTKAPFLQLQDEGGPKIPYKNYLAIPIVPFARPSKNALIPSKNLPKNLKNAFILTTKTGKKILCIRNPVGGRRRRGMLSSLPQSGGRQTSGLVTMYTLVPKANIKKASIFYDPIQKVVDRRMLANIDQAIDEALKVAR